MADQYEESLKRIQRILDDPTRLINAPLTRRQREVYRRCLFSDNHHQAALKLGISYQTLKNHITEARKKGAVTPTELRDLVVMKIEEIVNGALEPS